MTGEVISFKAFWETLLPQSNRRTGFSIRHAGKRNFVSFQLVGFQFSYQIDWFKPVDIFQEPLQRLEALQGDVGRDGQ